QVQYEGELVAVIGKRCKKVSEAEALDYVFGYTLGNDVSERTWQRGDRTFWRGKNTDTFKPMGPWIVTGLNPDTLRVTIRLNGKEMFTYAVKDAIFGVRQFISRMSQYLTLYPGDVLWMGTDGATENMKDGDVVEVEVPAIGTSTGPPCWPRRSRGSSSTSTGAGTTSSSTTARCAPAAAWSAPTRCARRRSSGGRWGSPISRSGSARSTTRTTRPWIACWPSSSSTTAMRSSSTATPEARGG